MIYLQNIDNLQKKFEYTSYFKLFYKLVYKEKMYLLEKKATLY